MRTAPARALVRRAVEAGKAHSEARISHRSAPWPSRTTPRRGTASAAPARGQGSGGSCTRFRAVRRRSSRAKFWAACCGGDPSEDAPIEHLEALYDGYAQRYDAHLSDALRQGAGARRGECPRQEGRKALDCGCGTGLSGRALFDAEACSKLDGVDLSEAMCRESQSHGLYDTVAKGELLSVSRRPYLKRGNSQ